MLLTKANALKASFKEADNREKVGDVIVAITGYHKAFQNYADLIGKQQAAGMKMSTASDTLQQQAGQLQAAQKDAMVAAKNRAKFWMIAISLVGALVGIVLAVGTARPIVRPVRACMHSLEEVAQGRLQQSLPAEFTRRQDEIGNMARAMANMIVSLPL